MHMKKIITWKKRIALLVAAMMILTIIPSALAISPDWADLAITLNWKNDDGSDQTAGAVPVYEAPGSFWACVGGNAIPGTIVLSVNAPYHPDWFFTVKTEPYREDVYPSPVGDGITLDIIPDAGDQLNSMTEYIEIQAADPYGNTEIYHLYLSRIVQQPTYVDVTPEPTEEPTPEPTDEPHQNQTEEQKTKQNQ